MFETQESSIEPKADSSQLQLTEQAARKISQLVMDQGHAEPILRVFIEGGGCSGFQYGFTFEDAALEDDMIVQEGVVKLVVDPMSYQYLMGSQVDYKEDLQGARFVINNPNASTTCGCGSSFSV